MKSQLREAAQAAGRPEPDLLAVSKRHSADAIRELLSMGQSDFGENYVQEAADKVTQLADRRDQLTWHLIGHLQSNKAGVAAEIFDWIHTIDRVKLLEPLNKARENRQPLNLLIQVNIDDDDAKHGCAPDEIDMLADAIAAYPMLKLRGLMTIGAVRENPEDGRHTFRRMRELFDDLRSKHDSVDTLSMGMSGDYPVAIDEGATMIRVGTAIFGERN